MDSPNPVAVAWSIIRVLVRTKRPVFGDAPGPDHSPLGDLLTELQSSGIRSLITRRPDVDAYVDMMQRVEVRSLQRDHALAYWLNLYNAGALRLAATASQDGKASVLRIPGGFSRPFAVVDGERLSMDAIEHGKIRRFGDPRIHGALVCGSVSCPTLRAEPYSGDRVDVQLDDQMQTFLRTGGAVVSGQSVQLSRVFLWYGGDFAYPSRMPTFLPARRSLLLPALATWMEESPPPGTSVDYLPYDWGLRCVVG